MPNHYLSIGFILTSDEDAGAAVEQALEEGDSFDLSDGSLTHWRTDSGAEFWIPQDARGEVEGLEPHYDGASRFRARLNTPIPGDSPLLGSFHAWAGQGEFPFVFAAPDYPLHRDRPLPYDADVQLVGFAHSLSVYPNEEAFAKSQEGGIRYATESFIPSGLFIGSGEDGKTGAQPSPFAFLNGVVQEAELRVNDVSGGMFYAARVRTLGGELVIVTDTETLEGELKPGAVVSGEFYLSGRVFPEGGNTGHD